MAEQTVDIRTGEVTTSPDRAGTQTESDALAAAQVIAQQDANGATLQQQASDALANLRAYRDLASPTNAQTVAAVKLLCRVSIGLIRLSLRKYDATD